MTEPVLFGFPLHLLFLYFIIYSFLGWGMETIYCSVLERRLVPRGFLLGPICPIYGVGVLMMICWFAPFMDVPPLFYVVATVCMSAWEYFVGWFLEVTTHIKYWDYSMYRFNLKGRICLWVCLTWGVLAYLILFWIHPCVVRLVLRTPLMFRYVLCILLAAVLLADAVTTVRKLALTAALMRRLDEARAQLAQSRGELEEQLQQAKAELSARLEEAREEFSARLEEAREGLSVRLEAAHNERIQERTAKLQAAYDELLIRAERHSRRFRARYHLSSRRYERGLSAVKELAAQARQRLEQLRAERKKK